MITEVVEMCKVVISAILQIFVDGKLFHLEMALLEWIKGKENRVNSTRRCNRVLRFQLLSLSLSLSPSFRYSHPYPQGTADKRKLESTSFTLMPITSGTSEKKYQPGHKSIHVFSPRLLSQTWFYQYQRSGHKIYLATDLG